MVRNPTMSPMRGDRTMNSRILPRPWGRRTERREWVTAAPARPPMRACDDDTGSPSHQVSRFHAMAPTRPPRMTQRSMATGSTTPLPTVVATFTPKPNAATKLKKAAQATATFGDRVPVDTTVATELAASWKPFRKSKTSATRMMAMTESRAWSMGGSPGSARAVRTVLLVLQDDALEDDGNALAGVRGRLEGLDDLLRLDDEDRIAPRIEDARHGLAVQPIPFLLELVDAGAVLHDRPGVLQVHARLPDLLRLPVDDPRQIGRVGDLAAHLEQHGTAGDRVDQIDHVVHARPEVVDVLPVDRRDEGTVQRLHQPVDQHVAAVLDLLDAPAVGCSALRRAVPEHLLEDERRLGRPGGHGLERDEEQAGRLLDAPDQCRTRPPAPPRVG